MARNLILLTGATGHIGSGVLLYALDHGYQVRAVVRSKAKADLVQYNRAVKATGKAECLSTVIIPDFTVADAFDEAVKGVDFVIHCASPIPFGPPTTDNAYEDFIKPAVESTLGVLRSAAKEPNVRRVVITSSCIAVAPVAAAMSDTGETYTAYTRQPEPDTSFQPGTVSFVAYAAGKVSALNQAEAWMKQNRPHFDTIHLMPSYVLGRNEMYTSIEDLLASPNSFPLNIVRAAGEGGGDYPAMAMVTNHVDDCARIHVEALNPRVEGGKSFMICYDCESRPQWDDAKEIVSKYFSEAVKAGILPNKGSLESVCSKLDSKETEETFGFKRTYEEAVVDLVEQYLQLLGKTQAVNGGVKN